MANNTIKSYISIDDEGKLGTFSPRISGSGNDDSSNTPLIFIGRDLVVKNYGFVTKKGFIIFLDALGMKGIWKRIHPMEVIKKWYNITSEFRLLEDRIQEFDFYYRALSDTIIIVLAPRNRDAIFSDLAKIFSLLIKPFLVGLKNRILFRGIISYGIIYWSEKLVLGEAIDDAAYYHNKLNWIGISTSPNITFNNDIAPNSNFIPYNIPYKNKNITNSIGLALSWPLYDHNNTYWSILKDEESQADNSAKIKYNYTYQFYQYCISL